MKAMRESESLCPYYHRAVELIGRRWTGAVVFVLLRGPARFSELRAAIPDITDRMLSDRLRELEQEGVVDRRVIPDAPVRVEYSLTQRGEALAAAVEAIGSWAREWLGPESAASGA
jgi:DNA-binding HxlR family transcriptional regulator